MHLQGNNLSHSLDILDIPAWCRPFGNQKNTVESLLQASTTCQQIIIMCTVYTTVIRSQNISSHKYFHRPSALPGALPPHRSGFGLHISGPSTPRRLSREKVETDGAFERKDKKQR